MTKHSLRRQLLGWVLVPLALLAVLNAYTSRMTALGAADLVTDRMLLASARSIAEQTRIEDGMVQATVPPAALEMFDTGEGDFVYYSVADDAGRLLAGTSDLPPPGMKSAPATAFEADYQGRRLRLVRLHHVLAGPGLSAAVAVMVGVTLNSRDVLVRHLWLGAFAQQFVLLGAAAVFIVYGLRRGLAPLLRLRDRVLSREARSLEPLDESAVQMELRPLVDALNQQMARVGRQLAAQHRFVVNAAHQLRTPLTLLNVQATYALRRLGAPDAEATLRAIQVSTTQLSRLAGQLLTLSRAEPGSRRERAERIELRDLAVRVLDDHAAAALARSIDLGLEVRKPAAATGDGTMVGEMLSNLVDNALRYGRGAVTVTVDGGDGIARLLVEDDGPGVPAGEEERIFERFYRVPGTAGEGSGLGLAIVMEVVATAGGSVEARRGASGGLLIEVSLPAPQDGVSPR